MTLVIFCRLQCSRPSGISKIPAITRGWFYGYCLQVHWSHPLHLPMIHRNLVSWYYVGGSGKVTQMSVLSNTNLLTQIYLWDHCSYFRGAKQISDLFRLCRWTWPAFTKARKNNHSLLWFSEVSRDSNRSVACTLSLLLDDLDISWQPCTTCTCPSGQFNCNLRPLKQSLSVKNQLGFSHQVIKTWMVRFHHLSQWEGLGHRLRYLPHSVLIVFLSVWHS